MITGEETKRLQIKERTSQREEERKRGRVKETKSQREEETEGGTQPGGLYAREDGGGSRRAEGAIHIDDNGLKAQPNPTKEGLQPAQGK